MARTLAADPPRARRASDSPRARALRRLLRHRLALAGIAAIAIVAVLSVVGSDQLAYTQHISPTTVNQPPGGQFLLGTDSLGRDVLARTLVAGRVSLLVALGAAAIATIIATIVGVIAGMAGGWVDQVLMRLVDIILSFPGILLLLVIAALVGPGIATLIVIIGGVTWVGGARIVRAQVLALRDAGFVEAARVVGTSPYRIVVSHILPHVVAPLVVYATFGVANVVIFEASLSYLGVGITPPTPSWGNLVQGAHSVTVLETRPWQWGPAALLIVVAVLAVNFIGDGLRDAFDQRVTT